MRSILSLAGYVLRELIILAIAMIWGGYALGVLWGWFIVPTFHLQPLTVPAAAGLMIVASFLQSGRRTNTVENHNWMDEFGENLTTLITKPLIVLFLGWIVKQYM